MTVETMRQRSRQARTRMSERHPGPISLGDAWNGHQDADLTIEEEVAHDRLRSLMEEDF